MNASAADPAPLDSEVQRVASRVDAILAARWQTDKLEPVAAADDAEFLRRVYLDLTGRIPPVIEARAFLNDKQPDKRRKLVERLLSGQAYANHFSIMWQTAWLPDVSNEILPPPTRAAFEAWVRVRLSENAGYDQMVREILTQTPPRPVRREAVEDFQPQPTGLTPIAFFQANENKPENLAAATSRLFLGVRLECAQCHNHFFAKWTREQFWQYAAFFNNGARGSARGDITIPSTGKRVSARFPDGKEPAWKDGVANGAIVADWMTSAENKYFGRAAVNRMWAHFLGAGLAEPVDDIPEGTKDEVLDVLAKELAAHRYDLKFLIRVIVSTRAYQLASAGPRTKDPASALFSRMAVKPLSPEQILAGLAEATGTSEDTVATMRADLLAALGRPTGGKTGVAPSIPQALALMYGKFVNDATSLEQSTTLAAVANAPFLNTAERIETLYLAVLSRQPTESETARLVKYIDKGGPSGDKQRALADVFWVLLNSSEFILNH